MQFRSEAVRYIIVNKKYTEKITVSPLLLYILVISLCWFNKIKNILDYNLFLLKIKKYKNVTLVTYIACKLNYFILQNRIFS